MDFEKKINQDHWVAWSDETTIKEIRKLYDLPELGTKEYLCSRCRGPYKSQTQGGRRVHYFCYDCQQWQARQTEWI